MRKQQGFTLVEVTIILLVLAILSTIMLPQLGNFNRLARYVKAREDVGAICASLKKMMDETFVGQFLKDPNNQDANPIGILYGPGSVPAEGAAVNGGGNGGGAGTSECAWNDVLTGDQGVNGNVIVSCQETTDADANAITQAFVPSRLENHLMENDPAGNNSAEYPNPIANPLEHAHGQTGVGGYFGWRGPYLDWLSHDPWGNRYAVNTFALHAPLGAANNGNQQIYTSAVVCYSAGANERIDSDFNQPTGSGGTWEFGVDDLGAVLSAGGPF